MLGEAVGPALCASRLLPAITAQARDSVPNVRFNVAKALNRLSKHVDAGAVSRMIRPCLSSLVADRDADVRFYAQRAFNSLPA